MRAKDILSSTQTRAAQIVSDYGLDRWTRQKNELDQGVAEMNKYLQSGAMTAEDNSRYRETAQKAYDDLDREMSAYGSGSNRYKQLSGYRDYYQNALGTMRQDDLRRSVNGIGDYFSSGKYTADDNSRYRREAEQAIKDLDEEMTGYKKDSEYYKMLAEYRDNYSNIVKTFDRTDAMASTLDYINADAWHSPEAFASQKQIVQDNIDLLTREMDAYEDKESDEYKELQTYKEVYESLLDDLDTRNKNWEEYFSKRAADAGVTGEEYYASWQKRNDYGYATQIGNTLREKEDALKQINPAYEGLSEAAINRLLFSAERDLEIAQSMGAPSDYEAAKRKYDDLAAAKDLASGIDQLRKDQDILRGHQINEILYHNYGGYDKNTDYQKIVDDLNEQLKLVKEGTEDYEKIRMQILAIAGANGDGTDENGLYDRNTFLGRHMMEGFNAEEAEARLAKIADDMRTIQEEINGLSMGVVGDDVMDMNARYKDLTRRQADLQAEKRELQQKLNSSNTLKEQNRIGESIAAVPPEEAARLVESGKAIVKSLNGKSYTYYGQNTGYGTLPNFDALDDEYGADIRDAIYMALGAKEAGVKVGFTVDDVLKAYQADINEIGGMKDAKAIDEMENGVARWLRQEIGVGLLGGAWRHLEHLPDFFTDEIRPDTRSDAKLAYTKKALGDRYGEGSLPGDQNFSQMLLDVMDTTGNMLPGMVLSWGVGTGVGAAGAALGSAKLAGSAATLGKIAGGLEMGASSGGRAYQQALKEGWAAEDARVYGAIIGTAESTMQYALSGIPGMVGMPGLAEEGLLRAAQMIDNTAVRIATKTAINIGSEITEELAQNKLQAALDYYMFGKGDSDWMQWTEDDWNTVLVTALSTALMEAGPQIKSDISTTRTGEALLGERELKPTRIDSKAMRERKLIINGIGEEMKGSEALSETLKVLAQDLGEDSNAYKLAKKMADGKLTETANNYGTLFNALLEESGDANKMMAAIIGGAVKYNDVKRAKAQLAAMTGELDEADAQLAEICASNPGAVVLNRTATSLQNLGADPIKAVETSAVINKVRNGQSISSREMAQLTGSSNEAKAARKYLAETTGDVNFAANTDPAVTEALVTELIKTNKEQKALEAEELKAAVLAAGKEAAADVELARATAGATKIVASDVKALQAAKQRVADAEQKVGIAQRRLSAAESASFEEMAEAGSADKLLIDQLSHEREVLRTQIEGLTGNRILSKAQARKLADLRKQYAEVDQKLQTAARMILSERNAERQAASTEAAKAEAAQNTAEKKTNVIPPKAAAAAQGETATPQSPARGDADTAVLNIGGTEVARTRADYVKAMTTGEHPISEEEANQKFDDMVAMSGGREGTVNNEQTADQNEGRSDLGGQRDRAADQERGDRPEKGSDARGDRGRRKLSTLDGSREVDLKEEVDSDATVTHSDDLSALEETHSNIRAFTDELLQAGFKRVTYVTNGRMYNEVGEAVPGFYNNGELFLALDPVPGWAGAVATAEHEKTHLKLDLYRASFNEENGPDEGDAFVSATLQNILGKDRYVDAFRKYWKRYSPVYLKNNSPQAVAHMVNEEMLCDMAAGIDNFEANLGEFQESARDMLEVSGFDAATENLAAGMAPGPVSAEYIDSGAMPHNIPVDTLLSDTDVDTPSTQPVNPGNVSKLAFYGLASALGFKVDKTNPKSKVYYLNDEDARLGRNGFTQITVDMIKASPIGNMIRYAQDKGYITEDQAEQEYNLFASIGSISDQTHDFYQAMQFMGSTIFTALKMNSDPQYGTTYDFPSICTKTQAVIDDMSAQMVELKRALTEDEILEIYQRQFTAGNPVPCPECYVFSRWVGIGGLLDNIYYYQETYGSMTPEEVARIYEENADKVAKAAEAAGVNFGKQKSKMASELQKKYNDLKEKREKAESVGKSVSNKALADEEALRRQMSDIRSLSWIDNVYFSGKEHLAKNVNKNFRVPVNVLFDLNEGETFARDFKDAWAFRTTQGAGYGKAITPYAEAILGEGIQITKGNGAIKLKAEGKLDHIFLTEAGEITDRSERGKALKAATKKQLNQLFIGGQRFQSTSDARFDNAVDYLLAGLEMQTMHGGVQVYTKVPGAVHFFNLLGMCTNMSLMPKGSGLDANDVPVDTTTGGMNPETAMMLRLGNEYAGTITIGVNDAHIRAMFNQAFRDFIIPYHASGGKAALISEFRRIQEGKAKGEGEMPQSTDYTNTQTDKFVTDEILRNDLGYTEAEIEDVRKFRATRIYILTNGSKRVKNNTFYREMLDTSADGLTESQINARKILQQLYVSMQPGGDWHGVELSKGLVEGQIFPNEFWDTSVSYDESGVNTQRYLDYCKALGVLHRFSGKGVKTGNVTNKDGTVTRRGYVYNVTGRDQHGNEVPLTDLAYKNGKDGEIETFFWKTLTDRRMYGNQGQYLKQPRVDLTNLKAENVVTFAAPMGERRYDRKVALRTAAQPLQGSQSRNSIQSAEIELTRDPIEEAEEGVTTTRYSLRQEPPPKKTQWGFKLMTVDENGLPHAMFIDAAAPYEYGVWYNADSPKLENLLSLEPGYAYLVDADDNADMATRKPIRKVNGSFRGLPSKAEVNQATMDGKRWMVIDKYADGSVNVQNVGINGSGGISTFALRPGIHAVDIPSMAHIGAKSEGSKKIDTRRPNQRWFLIEYPVDNDYNQEAYGHRTKDIREHLPENGWYSFQTNSGAEARQHWFITGGMKIVGAVSEADIRKFAKERGFEEDLPWKQGKAYSEDDAIDLDEYIRTATAQPTPSKTEMRQRIESERKANKPVIPPKNALKKQAAKTESTPKSQPSYSTQGQPATAERETPRYSIAGPSANTSNSEAQQEAGRRLEAGESAETVRKDTGWYRGMDGKWRFEIDNSEAFFDRAGHAAITHRLRELAKQFTMSDEDIAEHEGLVQQLMKVKKGLTVGDFLYHPALFEAYPQLAQIELGYKKLGKDILGEYSPWQNQINISSSLRRNDAASMSVLLHELQHAIQRIEGFAPGANAGSVGYNTAPGEIEAKDVQSRLYYSPEQRKQIPPDLGENRRGPLFSVQDTGSSDPAIDSLYPPDTLENDLLRLVGEGPEAVSDFVNEALANHEDALEAAKIKAPPIPSKGFVPRVTKSERGALDRILQDQIRKMGSKKPSEKSNGFLIPAKRKEGENYRRYYQNVGSAKNLPADAQDLTLRQLLTSTDATYVPDSDEKLIKDAKDEVSELGYGSALTVYKRDSKNIKLGTKDMLKTIALGEQLLIEAAHQGDAANYIEVLATLSELGTTVGKSLQAFRLLKMSGPIGELYYIDRAVKRINGMNEDRIKRGTANEIVAKPELCQAVIDAQTAEERDEAMNALKQDLADQCPKTLFDRWNAWRYLSMLGNVRTHVRNIIGNAVFVPLRYTKDLMAAGGEFLATKAGLMEEEDRRKAVRVSRELRDFALADADVMKNELQGNGKYNPAQEILGMRKLLPGFLDTLSRINSNGIEGSKLVLGLEGEDWTFLRPAYARALAMQLEHSPYSLDELQGDPEGQRALNEMRKIAILEAQKATYRDFSEAAAWLNRGKQMQGAGRIVAIGLEGVLPFTKTPINILKRGMEYSPIGIAKGLYTVFSGLKAGEIDVAEAIDQLAAGLTGTGVAALGWLLARMGWLRGKKSDDDEENFDKLQGYQDYSLQIGNQSFTIDWAAPTALPLFVGAAVADLMEEDHELSWGDAWNAIMMIAEPMTSLSMLDGVNKLLDATSYASGSEKLAVIGTQAATSYLGQAFPTILGQVARTIDGTRRSSYIDKNSPIPAAAQRFVQSSVQSKIPGWESAKVPYIDAWGRQSEAGSMVLNGIENFFMPYYRSVKNTTAVDEELQKLYKSTKADILPSVPQKYFSVGGERKDLTADEWVSYATDVGQTKYALLTQLLYDPRYLALSDDQKAKVIKDYIYKYATTVGKYHVEPTYDIHGAGRWIEEAEAAPNDYARFERIWQQIEKSLKD